MSNFGKAAVAAAFVVCLSGSMAWADGEAADGAPPAAAPTVKWTFGTRVWYSTGTSEFNLYGAPGVRVSALHYNDTSAISGEAFTRLDATQGFFIKAVAGYGGVQDGTLIDEDFPPAVSPYSKTTSEIPDGTIDFASIDLGYNVVDEDSLRLGIFAGLGYWHEHFEAYGCRQIGSNPAICGFVPLPATANVISEDNKYRSIRLGVTGDGHLTDDFSWTFDAAYLITDHDNLDVHHFTFGPLPASGD
ncbi:MAG: hypothetical protein GC190_18470, partial [Alphaproteobacteria bacterium]|nr:hypothetical protein [Alphaproteobacteria bacterium]